MGRKEREKSKAKRTKPTKTPTDLSKPDVAKVEKLPPFTVPEWMRQIEARIPLSDDLIELFSRSALTSRLFGHNYIGTEHLLLGFYSTANLNVKHLLESAGLYARDVAASVQTIVGRGDSTTEPKSISIPMRVEKTTKAAAVLSIEDEQQSVKAEYLFIAMMQDGESIASGIVSNRVWDLGERLRKLRASLKPRKLPEPKQY